jgi:hypothetical protein
VDDPSLEFNLIPDPEPKCLFIANGGKTSSRGFYALTRARAFGLVLKDTVSLTENTPQIVALDLIALALLKEQNYTVRVLEADRFQKEVV